MLVFWGLVIWGLVVGIRWLVRQGRDERPDRALETLRERYARGEIGKEEFEAKRRDLADERLRQSAGWLTLRSRREHEVAQDVPLDLAFWNRRESTTDAVDETPGRSMHPSIDTLEVPPRLMYW